MKKIDVFIVAGQSNASGVSDPLGAPIVNADMALQFVNGAIKPANAPVGQTWRFNTGAWPQFANTYNQITGKRIGFIPTAVPGTGSMSATDTGAGHWGPDGPPFNNSLSTFEAAMAAFRAARYEPILRGILWSQGENDAIAMYNSVAGVTQASYKAATQNIIARFRLYLNDPRLPFYIFRTGSHRVVGDNFFAPIRAAQEEIAASDPFTTIVFRDAASFVARGLLAPGDDVHYSQAGYNEMGRWGAQAIANGRESGVREKVLLPADKIALTSAGPYQEVARLTLGPGLHEVSGSVRFQCAVNGTVIAETIATFNEGSAAYPTDDTHSNAILHPYSSVAGLSPNVIVGPYYVSVEEGATKDIVLGAYAVFSIGGLSVYGGIRARPVE